MIAGLARVAAVAGLLVLGVGTGLASVLVHDKSWGWFVLASATPVLTSLVLPQGWLRSGFGLGWLLVLALAIWGRPEGDAALAADARGYGLYVVALVMITIVVATLPRPNRLAPPSP